MTVLRIRIVPALANLEQKGSVNGYTEEFWRLTQLIPDLSETDKYYTYKRGLSKTLQPDVMKISSFAETVSTAEELDEIDLQRQRGKGEIDHQRHHGKDRWHPSKSHDGPTPMEIGARVCIVVNWTLTTCLASALARKNVKMAIVNNRNATVLLDCSSAGNFLHSRFFNGLTSTPTKTCLRFADGCASGPTSTATVTVHLQDVDGHPWQCDVTFFITKKIAYDAICGMPRRFAALPPEATLAALAICTEENEIAEFHTERKAQNTLELEPPQGTLVERLECKLANMSDQLLTMLQSPFTQISQRHA
ncbi:MAG: hypothetical protein BJ554DRAFT_4478 [Olpidium bornovanus]|uniref:Uncharacterized protein n=1 Tax=Olpidium bornovanus TaxID=278681 RepID=A0A8H8A043_9FUNG|nr:MAG: hypothetical protein BJ554DRAFT_4478 [Olpidium bornovanus]